MPCFDPRPSWWKCGRVQAWRDLHCNESWAWWSPQKCKNEQLDKLALGIPLSEHLVQDSWGGLQVCFLHLCDTLLSFISLFRHQLMRLSSTIQVWIYGDVVVVLLLCRSVYCIFHCGKSRQLFLYIRGSKNVQLYSTMSQNGDISVTYEQPFLSN